MHAFAVGQTVEFSSEGDPRFNAAGVYVVTQLLPETAGEFAYRIKSAKEGHERTAREGQLTAI
jgi:hypothetical protein